MGISARQLAADIDVSTQPHQRVAEQHVADHGRHGAAPGSVLQHGAPLLVNLQSEYDMRMAVRETKAAIALRIRVFHPVAA